MTKNEEVIADGVTILILGLKRFIQNKSSEILRDIPHAHSLLCDYNINFEDKISEYTYSYTGDTEPSFKECFGMKNDDTFVYYNYLHNKFCRGLEVNVHTNEYKIIDEVTD